jgi:Fe-S oxidoreductase
VRVNQRRFAELMQTQSTIVAVACPYCPIMLRDAANALQRDDVEILDIAEIVARNLALNREETGAERRLSSSTERG